MQPWSLLYRPFGCRIARVHDRRRVCDTRDGKNGCRIDHPLLSLLFNFLPHPLFLQAFRRMQNFLNVCLEELDELTPVACCVGDGSCVRQFFGECSKMLIRGKVGELTMLWKQFRRTRHPVRSCLGDVIQITTVMVLRWAEVPVVDAA